MTKPIAPNSGCDLCGQEIKKPEKNYTFEVYDGSPWGKSQTKAENMDCCHKCFLHICEIKHFDTRKYIPNWQTTVKNPKYTKANDEPYRLPINAGITITHPELTV